MISFVLAHWRLALAAGWFCTVAWSLSVVRMTRDEER